MNGMLGKKPSEKQIQELMKKMNINVQEIKAEEVIIKCADKTIIVSQPEVMLTKMMGKEVFQVTGEISEASQVREEDIRLVMEKTGKDRDIVAKKLEELNNDLAKAILELRE